MELHNLVDGAGRKPWSTPTLDQLTVDLQAIAGTKKTSTDNPAAGKSTS